MWVGKPTCSLSACNLGLEVHITVLLGINTTATAIITIKGLHQ